MFNFKNIFISKEEKERTEIEKMICSHYKDEKFKVVFSPVFYDDNSIDIPFITFTCDIYYKGYWVLHDTIEAHCKLRAEDWSGDGRVLGCNTWNSHKLYGAVNYWAYHLQYGKTNLAFLKTIQKLEKYGGDLVLYDYFCKKHPNSIYANAVISPELAKKKYDEAYFELEDFFDKNFEAIIIPFLQDYTNSLLKRKAAGTLPDNFQW